MTRVSTSSSKVTLPRTGRPAFKRRGNISRTNTALAFVTLVVALGYVFLINDVSTKGYEIQSLRRSGSVVNEELAKAKRQADSVQSMGSIADRLHEHTFVPEGSVEYAHPGSPVALGVRTE